MHTSIIQKNGLPSTAHQLFPKLHDRLLITPVEAGEYLGWAKQTVYNKLNDGVFPIPLVEFNGRKMVKTSDLLEHIKNLPYVKHVFKKVGRPTKSESIRRASEKKEGVI